MNTLRAALDRGDREDRQRAMRALLQRPLLTAGGTHADDYWRVRRNAEWLREWLQRNAGWRLDLDAEVARLRKTPGRLDDGTRALRDSKNVPFTRRRYILLSLTLAELERADRQTTLSTLAERVAGAVKDDPTLEANGYSFDLTRREHRQDFVAVLRALLDTTVIQRRDGDEERYVSSSSADVLYDVHRGALSRWLSVQRGPSTVAPSTSAERVAAISTESYPEGDDARNRRIRHRLVRQLLDDAVVLSSEMSAEERAYLATQAPHIAREIEEATGLVAEVRREGMAMVDPDGELSDIELLEDGTEGHAAYLLASWLAARARSQRDTAIPRAAIYAEMERLVRLYGSRWRKDVREAGAATMLADRTLDRLRALRLVRVTADGVIPEPPIARFAVRVDSDDRAHSEGEA